MDKWKDIELEKMKVSITLKPWLQQSLILNRVCFRLVEIKKPVNSSKVNRITTIPCPFSKSITRKRPHCIAIKYPRWLRANRGVKRHPRQRILVRRYRPTHRDIPVRGIQAANAARWRLAKAIKTSATRPEPEAIRILIHRSSAIKKTHFSIASKRRMHLDQSTAIYIS